MTATAGEYPLDDARDVVGIDLVGIWEVTARHGGDDGCAMASRS